MANLKRKQVSAGVDAPLESQTKRLRRPPASAAPHAPDLVQNARKRGTLKKIGTNREEVPREEVVNGNVAGAGA
jgi:hypothetical protein